MASEQWLPALHLRQWHVDKHFKRPNEAEKQLYLAVVQGKVRARLNGIVFGPAWLKQLSNGNAASVPPDIELSVDDVRRIWG